MTELRRRHGVNDSEVVKTYNDDDKRNVKILELLDYRHWFILFAFISYMYLFLTNIDSRYPNPTSHNDYSNFSEIRARSFLEELVSQGPRPSGSPALEEHAVSLMYREIEFIRKNKHRNQRLDVDEQRPTGCFDLAFLADFTLCYQNVTNLVIKLGAANVTQTEHSVLVNCHLDSIGVSPGATDDGVSCAIMIDILKVLSRNEIPLPYDVIFLFNGAEENFLQASHGFITQHPWRHSIRAVLNLEGAGAGGREMLFQATPGNSWLIQTYLEHAPYPHTSILAQEVFQSGIIPSDTDYRIFRDYGRVPGLDFAYIRNGYVYHTEFDQTRFIQRGAIQRSGENHLAVISALASSPYLARPGKHQDSQWVFFDVWGLFTVIYSYHIGMILNFGALIWMIATVMRNLSTTKNTHCHNETTTVKESTYSISMYITFLFIHKMALIIALSTGLLLTKLVEYSNIKLVWYGRQWMLTFIYILPMAIAMFTFYDFVAKRNFWKNDPFTLERCCHHAGLSFSALVLFLLIYNNLSSAFMFMLVTVFLLMREPIVYTMESLYSERSALLVLWAQFIVLTPVLVLLSYPFFIFKEIFIPIMGRAGGGHVNPEIFIMLIAFLPVATSGLFFSSLVYLSRSLAYLLKCFLALSIIFWLLAVKTRIGYPYVYDVDAPRLKRIILLHTSRNLYDINDQLITSEDALWYQTLDIRSDWPDSDLTRGTVGVDCSKTPNEFCDMPFYGPTKDFFLIEHSLYVPMPRDDILPKPIYLKLLNKEITDNEYRFEFFMQSTDHCSFHITPLFGYQMKSWSFVKDSVFSKKHRSYLVFAAHGGRSPMSWTFGVTLENDPTASQAQGDKQLHLAVACHYIYGEMQKSPQVDKAVKMMEEKRKLVNYHNDNWKWAITPLFANAEVIARYF